MKSSVTVEPCLGVVMPIYNELATLERSICRVLAQPEVAELILVDDGSTDGSWERLQELAGGDVRMRITRLPHNRGKAVALRKGFAMAASPVLIVQDADLEYDPTDYTKLLEPIRAGQSEVVFGSRFLEPGYRSPFGFCHAMGNRVLTMLSNWTTGLALTDMQTCYKMFRRELLEDIQIEEQRFGFEPEFTAKLAARRIAICEVPVSYRGRSYREGKKIGWKDAVSAIRCIFKYRPR